uniref:Uncharacterized protein n=1 Tax=Ciona savignyi TaxID=51511 RepID=H2YRF3_CIOSA
MLQNSLPIQELNSALLRQDNVSVSRSQEIPAMSSAYGMNAYHESSPYNTNNKVTHAQNGNHQVGVGYENFTNSTSVGVLRHSSSGRKSSRQESGSDESLVEDRRGEKKLTSTPIPSDVEKTSSVSSGSHEESPSPEVEVGKPQDQNKTTCTESSYSNIEHQNGSPGFNGDCANSIPVPENVVEIDQDTIESPVVENGTCSSQPALKTSSTMKIFPQNSASAHKIPQASWPLPKAHTVVEATNSAKTKKRMANDSKESWSVRK